MKRDNKHDIKKLMTVVNTLQDTPLPSLSKSTYARIKAIPEPRSRAPMITFVSFSGAFAVFLVLVVSAQFALPGSPLYGIKRGTEYIRALIQPDYEESLIEVRKQELETLEQKHAPEAVLEEAATEYQKASGGTAEDKTPAEQTQIPDQDATQTERRQNWWERGSDWRNNWRNSDSDKNDWSRR